MEVDKGDQKMTNYLKYCNRCILPETKPDPI